MRVMKMLSTILFPTAMLALVACGGGQDQAGHADADAAAAPAAESERYRAVVVPEGLTWEDAKARAEADGGHLVTTSAEENALVYGLIAENPDLWVNVDGAVTVDGEENPIQVSLGPWVGLYQEGGAPEPAGGWTWVTGETSDYTNWLSGTTAATAEPNDMGGVEHYGHFFAEGLDMRGDTWNDMSNDPATDLTQAGVEFSGGLQNPRGYIVEFEP
jgi:hypothetical protein